MEMDDLLKSVELQQKETSKAVKELHKELNLDQQRQNLNSLEELRLEEERTSIFEGEKQQVIDQLRSIGSVTVAQLEYLLAKAGTVGDARVLAVIRALIEEKRIGVNALAGDVVRILESIDFENPTAQDKALIKKIIAKFPLGIEVLRFNSLK